MRGTQVQPLGQEDPLETEMATQSGILVWGNAVGGGAWRATVHGVARVGHDLVTKPPPTTHNTKSNLEVASGRESK